MTKKEEEKFTNHPHPLAGQTFRMINRWHGQNKYISFTWNSQQWDLDRKVRATYTKYKDAAPFRFHPVVG